MMCTFTQTRPSVAMRAAVFSTLLICGMSVGISHAKTTAQDAWARATVLGQGMGGGFVTLTSDQDAKLISASSPASNEVQLHTMVMDGERMRMQQVPEIALPAQTAVPLTGHYHLMFMGLKQPLTEGTRVPVTLKIRSAKGKIETLKLYMPVRNLAAHH